MIEPCAKAFKEKWALNCQHADAGTCGTTGARIARKRTFAAANPKQDQKQQAELGKAVSKGRPAKKARAAWHF